MTIAIIIATHGYVAEEIFKAAEIILGQQTNIAYVNFLPNETIETLIINYEVQITKLNVSRGLLFLIDTWIGIPFNAASRIVINKKDYGIITGLNIPMLFTSLLERNKNPSLEKLMNIAVKAASEGIKSLKTEFFYSTNTSSTYIKNLISPKKFHISNEHMSISFTRIDDRLINGQISRKWIKNTNVTRIIIVNDEIANNHVRKSFLTQAAPPGVNVHVVNIEKMLSVWDNPKYNKDRVMLVFTNPIDVIRVVKQGMHIRSIDIDHMSFRQGKVKITPTVFIDAEDIIAFKKLNDMGINIDLHQDTMGKKLNFMDLIVQAN